MPEYGQCHYLDQVIQSRIGRVIDAGGKMFSRRHVICAGGLALMPLSARASLPVPNSNALSFAIFRKGERIGTHALSFSQNDDGLTVSTTVAMAVYLGPIRVFHYNHHSMEHWKSDRFVSMDAKTDYDGEAAWCSVRNDGGVITVEGSKAAKYTAPANALPATHWNRSELQGPMINPQNGMLLRPAISDLGQCSLTMLSGSNEPAHHYAWRGEDNLDLWYDSKDNWVALTAVTKSGETLTYQKL
jgi:hypothetical protein